jgi:phosphohistidine phosphatase
MMEVYILRHGSAENAPPGRPDSGRELTDEGRDKTAAVAKMARRAGVKLTAIISSPYTRARQSAAIAAKELQFEGEIITAKELTPDSAPEAVWNVLRDHREGAALLAGHEPLLSHLISYLLAAPSLRIEMKKSAMVRIDIDSFGPAPHGVLRWMILPKLA